MIRRPPRSTLDRSSAASDVYKRQAPHYRRGVMRYLAAGWIAVFGLGACTEPGRRALGPTADTNCREVTPIAVDSVVDYGARPGPVTEFKMVSRSAPRFPKAVQSSNAMGYAVLSFVIDTGGSSSAARHASKRRPGGESSMTLSV